MNTTGSATKFHVVIQSIPHMGGWVADLQMVKSIALYADEITLISGPAALTSTWWREHHKNDQGMANIGEFRSAMANMAEMYAGFSGRNINVNEFAAAQQELIEAEEAGLLTINNAPGFGELVEGGLKRLGSTRWTYEAGMAALEEELSEEGMSRFLVPQIYTMLSILWSQEPIFPLFDDTVSEWAKRSVERRAKLREKEDLPPTSAISRARHVSLISNLFGKLPQLSNAHVNEIVDIRREFERPLIRFRAAMLKLSHDIKNEPWDRDFPHQVDLLVRQEVEPALLDLEADMRSNTYIERLSRKLLTSPLEVAKSSAIGLGLGTLASLPVAVSATLGVGLGAAITAYEVFNEWQEEHGHLERNQMYFYYQARERLTRGKGKRRPKRFHGRSFLPRR